MIPSKEMEVEGLPLTIEAKIVGAMLYGMKNKEITIPMKFLDNVKGIAISLEFDENGKQTEKIKVKGEYNYDL